MPIQAVVISCVIGLVVGQLLFKMCANNLSETGDIFSYKVISVLIVAIVLYGVTSLAWVWVLQKTELGKVYPFMALAFVLVPLGSFFMFGEKFHSQYFIGIVFIIIGIVLSIKS